MKKFLLCLLIVGGIFFELKAQEELYWGLRGGLNLSNIHEKTDADVTADWENRAGFRLGMVIGAPLKGKLYIEPGIYFTTLGMKYTDDKDEMKLNINYLQIPILLTFRPHIGENTRLHLSAGPYVACGVGGKMKFNKVKVDIFGDDELVKRFDGGISFSGGFSIKRFYIGMGYDLGLVNIESKSSDSAAVVVGASSETYNRNFWVGIGINLQ